MDGCLNFKNTLIQYYFLHTSPKSIVVKTYKYNRLFKTILNSHNNWFLEGKLSSTILIVIYLEHCSRHVNVSHVLYTACFQENEQLNFSQNCHLYRAPDKIKLTSINTTCANFFPKSYVWQLVRIVLMRRF